MRELVSLFTSKWVWGEKFKNDPHGEAKCVLINEIEQKIYEVKALLDSDESIVGNRGDYVDALNALYAARDAVESMWLMFNG